MTPTDRMLSVTPYDTVQTCVDLLEKKLFRYLPIVAPDDDSLRGILTVRDLLRPAGALWAPIAHLWENKPVGEILEGSVGSEASLREKYSIDRKGMIADAVLQMSRETLNFLVVVDKENDNKIHGVFTERHYVTYGSKIAERDGTGKNSTNEGIESIMTPAASMLRAHPGMDGAKCIDMMLDNNVRFMPVTNDEGTKMLGVLSLRDFLKPLWS